MKLARSQKETPRVTKIMYRVFHSEFALSILSFVKRIADLGHRCVISLNKDLKQYLITYRAKVYVGNDALFEGEKPGLGVPDAAYLSEKRSGKEVGTFG